MFVEDAFVPKGPKIELEGLGFHDPLVRGIANPYLREIRLAGGRAKTGELLGLQFDQIVSARVMIGESLQLTLGTGGSFAQFAEPGGVFWFGCHGLGEQYP